MKTAERVWGVGRWTIQPATRLATPLRTYGKERVPLEGGVVLAMNHFSWLDPPAFGSASPRTIYFMAKSEVHRVPGLGHLIRAFGAFAVRRNESDREAVRLARKVVSEGHALGLFVEGTRQRSGQLGKVLPGAGMAALQEDVPVVCGVVYGSQFWRPWNRHPVSIAWSNPMRFDGLPRSGKGYREASAQIGAEIERIWHWLAEQHAAGRPAAATPP